MVRHDDKAVHQIAFTVEITERLDENIHIFRIAENA